MGSDTITESDPMRESDPIIESDPNLVSISQPFVRRFSEKGIKPTTTQTEGSTMRVMAIVKATPESEAGEMPSEQLLSEMLAYNEQLVKAGIMLAGDGLHPSVRGKRIRFNGDKRTVIDGPFTETKELIAGYWLWQVRDMDEAVEWAKRCPNPMEGESYIELRQIFEAEDFGAEFTPELREKEERLRKEAAANA